MKCDCRRSLPNTRSVSCYLESQFVSGTSPAEAPTVLVLRWLGKVGRLGTTCWEPMKMEDESLLINRCTKTKKTQSFKFAMLYTNLRIVW